MKLFDLIRSATLGIDMPMVIRGLDGGYYTVQRTYLDSAATCLAVNPVFDSTAEYLLSTCSNSHTESTSGGRDTTKQLDDAHEDVRALVNAGSRAIIFIGSGITAATCFASEAIRSARNDLKHVGVVVVSALEHHSNMLPWKRQYDLAFAKALDDGSYDLQSLAALLKEHHGKVAVVAVTAVSNVTGVMPPLKTIADMAHAAGAYIYVDAAQAAAHIPLDMERDGIDFLGMSGHKMYAPGSPGVLIGPTEFFQNLDWRIGPVGGGSVRRVETEQTWFQQNVSHRYEAGTPNIPGAVALGAAARLLKRIGLARVRDHEQALLALALDRLSAIDDVVVYGPLAAKDRAAVIAFNIGDAPHGIVASALNDLFAIQTRNGCFCAQPYTRQQISAACSSRGYCRPLIAGKTGMVRASFGLYSNENDVLALAHAVSFIQKNLAAISADYEEVSDGEWQSKTFRSCAGFSYRQIVDRFVP